MKKYRKKPVVVEAWQAVFGCMPDWILQAEKDDMVRLNLTEVYDYLHSTWIRYEIGDYIVKGTRGELYPVKKEVFEETYEEVE
jgi:hypothetical protein